MARRLTLGLVGGVVALLGLLGLSACRTLSKEEVERVLLDLPKNAALREHGLERLTVDGPDGALEFTFAHVPAAGPTQGPPLVLVHGTPSSVFTWTDLVFGRDDFGGIAGERDVYLLDVVGHGVTRTEGGPHSFQRCADWIVTFLEARGLSGVAVAGNSYGGEFVWRAALDRPDLISHVVLLDSAGYQRADDEWLPEEVAMRENGLAKIGYVLNSKERIRGALEPHFATVTDDQVAEIHAICDNEDNWHAMVDLARDENGTRQDELTTLEQPTLLLWGERDVAYPVERFARQFERDIPRARLHVIPDCGHYPQEERPRAVAEQIRAFLRDRH